MLNDVADTFVAKDEKSYKLQEVIEKMKLRIDGIGIHR